MKWRMHSAGRFYDANESTVVYFDSHSGDTHLLSDFAAFILQQFTTGPQTAADLLHRISPTVELPDGTDLTQAMEVILEELVSLDILKRE